MMYEDEKRAYEKMLNSLTSLGNCKLKQGATTTHLWEWLPSKSLTAPSPGEDVREQELTLTTGDDAKWYRPLEDCLAVRSLGSQAQASHQLRQLHQAFFQMKRQRMSTNKPTAVLFLSAKN